MRKLTKIILPEVGVEDLKIRPRGDNRCESANMRSANTSATTLARVASFDTYQLRGIEEMIVPFHCAISC